MLAAALLTFTLAATDARQSLGGHEANPIMRPIVAHPAALYTVKLGSAALTTGLVAKLKHDGHPRLAWALWIGVNAAQAAVVARNARLR